MKILHVTEAYGGGLAEVVEQYRELTDFATQDLLIRHRVRDKTREPFIGSISEHGTILTLVLFYLFNARKYDIIHVHSSLAGVACRILSPIVRRPIVYSPHGYAFQMPDRPFLNGIALWVEKLLASRARVHVAVSSSEAQVAVLRLNVPEERVIVVPHRIEVPALESSEAPADRIKQIVGIGRLAAQKDPKLFAEIARQASRNPALSEYRFKWIGGGDAALTSRLRSAGVDVTGWLLPAEVHSEVLSSSLVLHTAAYEGMPVALVEALALGTPVLARDIPATRELPIPLFTSATEACDRMIELLQAPSWILARSAGQQYCRQSHSRQVQQAMLASAYRAAAKP